MKHTRSTLVVVLCAVGVLFANTSATRADDDEKERTTYQTANAAYTVWWVLWNNPGVCSGACGEDDLGKPGNSVFYAAGFVTGNDGVGNIGAELDAGRLPMGMDVLIPGGLKPGRGLRAEVHMVVRSHGPIVAGMVAKQIGTFDDACPICVDQQAVVFAPVP